MEWEEVVSSNIAAIAYDEGSKELHVLFSSGAVYVYSEVPPDVYWDFRAASSKGKYLGARIKGVYECKRV